MHIRIFEGPVTKSGLRNRLIILIFIAHPLAIDLELINTDSTSQTNKAILGWKKSSVAWGVDV